VNSCALLDSPLRRPRCARLVLAAWEGPGTPTTAAKKKAGKEEAGVDDERSSNHFGGISPPFRKPIFMVEKKLRDLLGPSPCCLGFFGHKMAAN
jgi:hypothetical protein